MSDMTPGGDRLKAILDLAARRAETIPDSHRTISKHKTAPTPGTVDPQWLRQAGERNGELLRQLVDAVKTLCDAVETLPGYGSPEWRRAVLAAGPQRPVLAPENVQEPRTPTPGSPGTPETLSVPLSAPEVPGDQPA